MGVDIQKGTTYATGGTGGQGTITSANLNAHVDDAVVKSTFITAKTERTTPAMTDNMLVESGGVLQRMFLSTLNTLLVTPILYSGAVIQTVVATPYTANANLAVIPSDDTIPQITEGTQILTLNITPRFTASTIRLTFHGWGSNTTLGADISAALFRTGNVNALNVTEVVVAAANFRIQLSLDWVDAPATTVMQTYSVRAGCGSGVARMNGSGAGRVFGGAAACTLIAQEIRS